MNKKRFPLIGQNNSKSFPLIITGFTETSSLKASFNGTSGFSYIPNYFISGNYVSNGGFEKVASGSSVRGMENWIAEYPYWYRVSTEAPLEPVYTDWAAPRIHHSGCSCLVGEPFIDGAIRTITSASFIVSQFDWYRASFELLHKYGLIFVPTTTIWDENNPEIGVLYPEHYETISASYVAQVNWYNGTSFLSSTTISTIFISEADRKLKGMWNTYYKNAQAPATSNRARIVLKASIPTNNAVITPPAVFIDDFSITELSYPLIRIYTGGTFNTQDNFSIRTPTANIVTNIFLFSGSSVTGGLEDVAGKSAGAQFSSTGTTLTIGHDGGDTWKEWIPFTIDFTGISKGIHVTSACLVITSGETTQYDAEKITKLRVGFDTTINPIISPISWSTLDATVMNANFCTKEITSPWLEGEQYTFDITDSAKTLFGGGNSSKNGITWTNGSTAAIIIKDGGSSSGAKRAIISKEGNAVNPTYNPPILKIEYGENSYTDIVRDTYMSSWGKNNLNYNLDKIYVGATTAGSTRPLLYFDVSSIPATATVMSACVCLYHDGKNASNSTTMRAYKMLKEWDLYTSSWNNQYTTQGWTQGGAGSPLDYWGEHYSGSITLTSTETDGWKIFEIRKNLVEGWVKSSSGSANYGLLLKTDNEASDQHSFKSSQYLSSSYYPYLKVYYTDGGTPYFKTIQNPGATAFTYLTSDSAFIDAYPDRLTNKYGGLSYVSLAGGWGYNEFGQGLRSILLKFNLAGAATQNLISATLQMYCSFFQDGGEESFTVHRILKWSGAQWPTWSESYVSATFPDDSLERVGWGHFWEWDTPGLAESIDYSSSILGTGTVGSAGWVTINLTNITELKNMMMDNQGIFIKHSSGYNRQERRFDSRTGTNPPKLNLTYGA